MFDYICLILLQMLWYCSILYYVLLGYYMVYLVDLHILLLLIVILFPDVNEVW